MFFTLFLAFRRLRKKYRFRYFSQPSNGKAKFLEKNIEIYFDLRKKLVEILGSGIKINGEGKRFVKINYIGFFIFQGLKNFWKKSRDHPGGKKKSAENFPA